MRDVPHVVIIGGGFGGLDAAAALDGAPVRVTLVDRHNQDTTCLPDTASDSLVRPASMQTLTSEQGERIRSNVSSALPKS